MALNSSRRAIGRALKALAATFTDPDTGLPVYGYTKLGATFDPGANTTWCDVAHYQGQGKPAGSGGNQIGWRIDEDVTFILTSGIGPYEANDSTAQDTMLGIQDIVLPALHTHFQLPDASNPANAIQSVYSVLPLQIDRSKAVRFPNGHWYLLWSVPVVIKQGYTITLTQP